MQKCLSLKLNKIFKLISLALILTALLTFIPLPADPLFEATKDLPVAYQGRFRSMDSASRLWLYDTYHKQQLKKDDLSAFHAIDPSALTLLWQIHFFGHERFDNAPFFWIHYAAVKVLFNLEPKVDRFSYNVLWPAINSEVAVQDEQVKTLAQHLQIFKDYEGVSNQSQKAFQDLYAYLIKANFPANEIALTLENRFPFIQRLQAAGTTLKMLPAKFAPGEWVSLHAFHIKNYDRQQNQLVPSNNFTSFSNENFTLLKEAYFQLENAMLSEKGQAEITSAAENFAQKYQNAYQPLAGKPYKKALDKALIYPTQFRLKAETLYYRLPLIEVTLFFYALALILMLFRIWEVKPCTSGENKSIGSLALTTIMTGFAINTAILIFRCYILQRPPVSNMFETVVYVPWIAVAIGLIFYGTVRSSLILAAAVVASFALLILLKLTQIDPKLENVQAVLDSQYWLIIHVLMVVGSYGAFAICGILGHFYLLERVAQKKESLSSEKIARGILHTMYVGVALLIPGTILGGVWAAESWGRFWDWDPKESWAFISACVYLLFIHSYTFHYIRDFGLAVGAILGLVAISFTWYGVNYVLGTGLHSYGFGSGGTSYYFLYLAAECLFILLMVLCYRPDKKLIEKN